MSLVASVLLLVSLSTPRALPQQIDFWDATHGVGVFWQCARSCKSALRTTADGGRAWRFVRAAPRFGSLAVAPGGSAWIGRLASTDHGRSWHPLPSERYQALAFSNADHGWGIDFFADEAPSTQHLVRTASGGRSWVRRRNPCDQVDESLVDLSAPTPMLAWALCSGLYGAGNDAKAIYRTRDGGAHWTLVNQADFRGSRRNVGSGLTVAGYADGIEVTASGSGWLWESRGWAYASRDGGRRWRRVPTTRADEREARSISFPTRNLGFMLIQDYGRREYRLARTRNGGRSWTVVRRWRQA